MGLARFPPHGAQSQPLAVIDAMVTTAAGPPGFEGTPSIGVLGASREAWWTVVFRERTTTRIEED